MSNWPDIPYEDWKECANAMHMWTQIAGKCRLKQTPWENHSWHATLYVNGRGLTTSLIPDGEQSYEILFDFVDHLLMIHTTSGKQASFKLEDMSVAGFDNKFSNALKQLDLTADYHHFPNEVADPIPFKEQMNVLPYQREAVERYWGALVQIDRVFKRFRTGFIGKVSPAHLFWGSFDFAVTRFSGRKAPTHPGGVPALPDDVTREAYSHEVSSAGFWPGGNGLDYPAFYSYAYPTADGFAEAKIEPGTAFFDTSLGEFVLPYDAVRLSDNPEETLLAFLQSTYEAAANLGKWDRDNLERPLATPLHVPQIAA